MTLRNFLRDVMDSLDLTEEDGKIYRTKLVGKGKNPIQSVELTTDDGRVLVFPTNIVLKNYDKSKELIFNPITENKSGTDTVAYSLLCKLTTNSIKARFSELSTHVLNVFKTLEQTKSRRLTKFATKIADISSEASVKKPITDELRKTYTKLLQSTKDGDTVLLTTISRRPYQVGEKTYNRGVIVNFPLYDRLNSLLDEKVDEYTINGVTFNKYQLKVFKALFELFFDGIKDDEVINFVSNDKNHPSFIATMKCYNELMSPILEIYKELKENIVGGTLLNFDISLVKDKDLDNLDKLDAELEVIPSEKTTTKSKSRSEDDVPLTKAMVNEVEERKLPYGPTREPYKPSVRQQVALEDDDVDPVLRSLRGGNVRQDGTRPMDMEPRYGSVRVANNAPGGLFNRMGSNYNSNRVVTYPHQNRSHQVGYGQSMFRVDI